jgi:hypothetical protein
MCIVEGKCSGSLPIVDRRDECLSREDLSIRFRGRV